MIMEVSDHISGKKNKVEVLSLTALRYKTKSFRDLIRKRKQILIVDRHQPLALMRALRKDEVTFQPVFNRKKRIRWRRKKRTSIKKAA
jgi:hypothetical protein